MYYAFVYKNSFFNCKMSITPNTLIRQYPTQCLRDPYRNCINSKSFICHVNQIFNAVSITILPFLCPVVRAEVIDKYCEMLANKP